MIQGLPHKWFIVIFTVSLISGFLSIQTADADIYQYIDEQGVLHLTDKPDNKNATLLKNSKKTSPRKKSYHTPKELKGRFERYISL